MQKIKRHRTKKERNTKTRKFILIFFLRFNDRIIQPGKEEIQTQKIPQETTPQEQHCTRTYTLSLSLSVTRTNTHSHTNTLSLFVTRTNTRTLSLSFADTNHLIHEIGHTHSHTLTRTHTHSHALTRTQTHSHTDELAHTFLTVY